MTDAPALGPLLTMTEEFHTEQHRQSKNFAVRHLVDELTAQRAQVAALQAQVQQAHEERDEAKLKLRLYENGSHVNQPLVDDIDRWRIESEQAEQRGRDAAERAFAERERQAYELNK